MNLLAWTDQLPDNWEAKPLRPAADYVVSNVDKVPDAAEVRRWQRHNYLVEHSAGSGKSNTIGWPTHRLPSLHDAANERVFDSVIVVTDRVVLDQQLQDTIYQFEQRSSRLSVVERERSGDSEQ